MHDINQTKKRVAMEWVHLYKIWKQENSLHDARSQIRGYCGVMGSWLVRGGLDKGSDITWILDVAVVTRSCSLWELSPDLTLKIYALYCMEAIEFIPKESVINLCSPRGCKCPHFRSVVQRCTLNLQGFYIFLCLRVFIQLTDFVVI